MNKTFFARNIVEWYQRNMRQLPWRTTSDPYKIWLSEIILQQTRVAQGLPYYLRFVEHFPNVLSLAAAREQDVLRLWQGLGYYTRARNLHRCAKAIATLYRGKFPQTFVELKKLPGIGNYTAAAIASIAFKESVAVADGNVYRVLSRVFGVEADIATTGGRDVFFALAQSLIPQSDPDQFNQGMMEFGALHCTPKNPKCDDCMFSKSCVAFSNDWQDRLPIKSPKAKVKKRYFYYFVFANNKKWAMHKRTATDIWQGLYQFYLLESNRPQKALVLIKNDPILKKLGSKILNNRSSPLYHHQLTHQKLFARFFLITVSNSAATQRLLNSAGLKFYTAKGIHKLPKPVLVTRYLQENQILMVT